MTTYNAIMVRACAPSDYRRWVWRHHGERLRVCRLRRFIAMMGRGRIWMSIVFATFWLLQMVYIFITSHHWQLRYLPTEMSKIHVTFDNRLKNVSPPICLSSLSYLIAFSVQFKTELNEWVSSRQLQQTPVANTQEHHFIMTWWAFAGSSCLHIDPVLFWDQTNQLITNKMPVKM